MIALVLVAVALVGYLAGRIRSAPSLLDMPAACGLRLLVLFSGGDSIWQAAPAGRWPAFTPAVSAWSSERVASPRTGDCVDPRDADWPAKH